MAKETLLFGLIELMTFILVGASYKKCQSHNDPTFGACLEEAANIYFANLDEDAGGIHKTWQSQKIKLETPVLTADVSYNVTKFVNSTKSIKVTLKHDAQEKTLSGTIQAPHVGFFSDVEIDGKFFNVILKGLVTVVCHVYDMDSSFETKLHIKPGTDDKFEMEELKFKVNQIRKAQFDVLDIKTENKNIEEGMRSVAKSFPDQLYSLSKHKWDDIIREHYEDLTRMFLKQMVDDGVITIEDDN